MAEQKEKRERENPISFLPRFSNMNNDFAGIFIIIALALIIFLYWNPFSTKEEPSGKGKNGNVRKEVIPTTLESPENTVLIMKHGDEPVVLGEIAPCPDPVKALSAIENFLKGRGIAVEEYKKGSMLKTDRINDIPLGKSVQMEFSYDASGNKIVARLLTVEKDSSLKIKADCKALFEKMKSKVK